MFSTDTLTSLMFAASRGDIPAMREALAQGAEINARDAEGWSAMHYAATTGEVAPVRALIQEGADIDAADVDGWSPVMWAAWQGDLDVLRLFSEYKDLREVLARGVNETEDAWVAIRRNIQQVLSEN